MNSNISSTNQDDYYSDTESAEILRKNLFQEAASQLMSLYKESLRKCDDSYNQGREDAYEEVLKWFLTYANGSGGNFKHVSVNEFFNFISLKLQDQRSGRGSKQKMTSTLFSPNLS